MKVLVIEPMEEPYVKEIDGSLESMQEIVGGWIETTYPHKDYTCIVCNEEGKLMGLQPNIPIYADGSILPVDIICGVCFVCGIDKEEGDFCGLTDEQIEHYSELYKYI